MDIGKWVLNLSSLVLVAIISAWVTVQLSLRRFKSERWWEKRVDAHSKIIEALHNAKTSAGDFFDVEVESKKLTEEREVELRHRARIAYDEILKAMDTEAFLLSEEALGRLKQYRREVDAAWKDEQPYSLFLDAEHKSANNCPQDIINIAKRDLKTK